MEAMISVLRCTIFLILIGTILAATTTKKPATTTKKPATTTKKVATTTKKPVPACGKCQPQTAVLMAASGPGTVKPTMQVVANTAAGCKRINVSCTAPAGATKASMEFNRSLGGPYEGKVVTATLTCDAQQKWRFSKDGAIIIVNSVNCMYV